MVSFGSCLVDMADNETFRFLGGLRWTNLFSVHTRIGACLGVLSGAKTGDLEAILPAIGAVFGIFGAQKRPL